VLKTKLVALMKCNSANNTRSARAGIPIYLSGVLSKDACRKKSGMKEELELGF